MNKRNKKDGLNLILIIFWITSLLSFLLEAMETAKSWANDILYFHNFFAGDFKCFYAPLFLYYNVLFLVDGRKNRFVRQRFCLFFCMFCANFIYAFLENTNAGWVQSNIANIIVSSFASNDYASATFVRFTFIAIFLLISVFCWTCFKGYSFKQLLDFDLMEFIYPNAENNIEKISSEDDSEDEFEEIKKTDMTVLQSPIINKDTNWEKRNKSVSFDTIMNNKSFLSRHRLDIPLGIDSNDDIMYFNIENMPHLLVAGATQQGKSVFLNTLLCSLLLKNTQDELQLLMIDLKRTELGLYKNIKHLLDVVAMEREKALEILDFLIYEMEDRYKILEEHNCRDIAQYRTKGENMPSLILVIDEMGDLTMGKKEINDKLIRLLQKSRAAGIHLILATQRPTVKVIDGNAKANCTSRISFAMESSIDSKTILDRSGAENLLGKGDMLVRVPEIRGCVRLQGIFINEAIIEKIVEKNKSTKSNLGKVYTVNKDFVEQNSKSFQYNKNDFEEINFSDDLTDFAVIKALNSNKGYISKNWIFNAFDKVNKKRAEKIFNELNSLGVIGSQESKRKGYLLAVKDRHEWEEFKQSCK